MSTTAKEYAQALFDLAKDKKAAEQGLAEAQRQAGLIYYNGAGVKQGFSYGTTDEYGLHAVEGRMHTTDLHATLLAFLGLDHEQLTYRYAGRDFRLTDVSGHVVHDIIA